MEPLATPPDKTYADPFALMIGLRIVPYAIAEPPGRITVPLPMPPALMTWMPALKRAALAIPPDKTSWVPPKSTVVPLADVPPDTIRVWPLLTIALALFVTVNPPLSIPMDGVA